MPSRLLGSAAMQIGAFELSARFSAGAVAGLRAQGRLGQLTRALAVQAWSSTRLGNLTVALAAAEEAARLGFDALGVIPWSERARSELRAAGEASPRRTPDARDQLTAHELSIAQLAADGLTNREIGQRLYLSHRTVSTHLHRIFPRLGISARGDLAAALGPLTAQ